MRLSSAERSTIRAVVRAVAGPHARVRLFGSRLDDHLRGGDIDLLVEIDRAVDRPVVLGAHIGASLQQAMGDRKIDVLLLAPNVVEQPIHAVARATGIEL